MGKIEDEYQQKRRFAERIHEYETAGNAADKLAEKTAEKLSDGITVKAEVHAAETHYQKCEKCKVTKKLTEFPYSKDDKGYSDICKHCSEWARTTRFWFYRVVIVFIIWAIVSFVIDNI